ncbi:MAG TPA: penicillin-binding transpeptidase domain-containing protein, partial [Solirubrobacteraceae bacterium]
DAAATWGQHVTARSRRPKGQKGPLVPIPPPATPHLEARFKSLARVLNMSPKTIQERVVQSLASLPYANVTVKVDVDVPRRNYLVEHPEGFPGIDVERKFLRRYPQHSLAAQLVGSIGEIDDQELKLPRFKGVTQGTVVGQGGLERAYDQYLRGVDGSTKITIDALGRPKSSAPGHDPVSGRSVRTTLDIGLQQTGEKYLDQTINQGPGSAGGFVALDPRDGSVLALGSYPTVNPSILSKPFSQATADRLFGDSGGAPLFNRAIAGSYPTGSTFKPITALAAMSTGVVQPGDVIDDHGCIKIGTAGQEACNAGKESLGPVNMTSALSKSSDVYFYTMGQRLNALAGQPLQKWARRMGLGHRTGIDTPGEFGGTVPDRAWRDRLNAEEASCRKKRHRPCGIADGTNRPWTEGDEVNLAVGQGDLQATPLQMAVAYSVLANGNHRVRPHLGAAVEDSGTARLLQRIEPGAATHVTIDPAIRQTILDGLHDATIHGTSADVWKGWDQSRYPVFGKTGTAQRLNRPNDQSWYVCFVNDPQHPIVVAVTIEDGGFGADAAAPVARTIVSKWFHQPIKYIAGKSKTF